MRMRTKRAFTFFNFLALAAFIEVFSQCVFARYYDKNGWKNRLLLKDMRAPHSTHASVGPNGHLFAVGMPGKGKSFDYGNYYYLRGSIGNGHSNSKDNIINFFHIATVCGEAGSGSIRRCHVQLDDHGRTDGWEGCDTSVMTAVDDLGYAYIFFKYLGHSMIQLYKVGDVGWFSNFDSPEFREGMVSYVSGQDTYFESGLPSGNNAQKTERSRVQENPLWKHRHQKRIAFYQRPNLRAPNGYWWHQYIDKYLIGGAKSYSNRNDPFAFLVSGIHFNDDWDWWRWKFAFSGGALRGVETKNATYNYTEYYTEGGKEKTRNKTGSYTYQTPFRPWGAGKDDWFTSPFYSNARAEYGQGYQRRYSSRTVFGSGSDYGHWFYFATHYFNHHESIARKVVLVQGHSHADDRGFTFGAAPKTSPYLDVSSSIGGRSYSSPVDICSDGSRLFFVGIHPKENKISIGYVDHIANCNALWSKAPLTQLGGLSYKNEPNEVYVQTYKDHIFVAWQEDKKIYMALAWMKDYSLFTPFAIHELVVSDKAISLRSFDIRGDKVHLTYLEKNGDYYDYYYLYNSTDAILPKIE